MADETKTAGLPYTLHASVAEWSFPPPPKRRWYADGWPADIDAHLPASIERKSIKAAGWASGYYGGIVEYFLFGAMTGASQEEQSEFNAGWAIGAKQNSESEEGLS
jgi:hypothetical protein